MAETKILSISNIATIGVITAFTCILAPFSIPIGTIPISLTNLVIYFGLYILGAKKEFISYCVYLLIGLVGLPVFSGFTAGPQKLFGPTGGYLIGFIPMAIIAGIFIERFERKPIPSMIGMMLGTMLCYAIGTAWLAYQAHMDFMAALAVGVLPFLVEDLIKIIFAAVVAPQIYKRLVIANVL